MVQFIGTKIINAMPMNRADYNSLRGWDLPGDEDGSDEGYLFEYPNSDKNTDAFEGYVSWSPKEQFEDAYRETSGMNFGLAIEAMKKGFKVARTGWNGRDMFVVFMSPMSLPAFNTQGTERKVNDRTAKWIGEDTPLESNGYFAMFTADKKWQPGWLASQTDMLADDWRIIN